MFLVASCVFAGQRARTCGALQKSTVRVPCLCAGLHRCRGDSSSSRYDSDGHGAQGGLGHLGLQLGGCSQPSRAIVGSPEAGCLRTGGHGGEAPVRPVWLLANCCCLTCLLPHCAGVRFRRAGAGADDRRVSRGLARESRRGGAARPGAWAGQSLAHPCGGGGGGGGVEGG